jgi:hypothetical protein
MRGITSSKWKQTILLSLSAIVVIALVSVLMGLALRAVPDNHLSPEIALTILLVTGLGGLVTLLVIAVSIFHILGLSDSNRAFGLPEGTIRAIIAIGLIIIFAMVSVFLYYQVKLPPVSNVKGITQEQLNAIPIEKLKYSMPSENSTTLYDVQILLDRNPASDDVAKQLLTTIGTLAVAVAGFYFGTQAVSAAKGKPSSSEPVIRGINITRGKPGETKILEILGKDFLSPTSVKFTFMGASDMSLEDIMASSSKIECKLVIPDKQKPGSYALVITNFDGGEDTLEDAFTVEPGV